MVALSLYHNINNELYCLILVGESLDWQEHAWLEIVEKK